MCAKMNWDRVRRENRVFQHGSAWIETGKVTDPPRVKSKVKGKSNAALGPPMPGCICGKTVGFTGAHKKQCPLSVRAVFKQKAKTILPVRALEQETAPPARPQELTLSTFSNSLRRAGLNNLWKELCRLQVKKLNSDKRLNQSIRDDVIRILDEFIRRL
jgi:hypothetical protein